MNQTKIRGLHRDLGYFYIGLIISFAFSGIMMNHREHWHPEKYTTTSTPVTVILPQNEDEISENFVKNLGKKLGIEDEVRRHKVKEGKLRVAFEKHELEVDLKSGKGELEAFEKTPIISHVMKLHKSTSNFWIYYSDIFGLSLITIAITGAIMIPAGKFTFKRRGWKLALAGLLFPLLFLIVLG